MVEKSFDWGNGTIITVKPPKTIMPSCGGGRESSYDPLNDCNVTNKIYELSLSYAKSRGEPLPSAEDTKRALQKILPGR